MASRRPPDALRVMTYNIRACLGIDNVRSIERIARIVDREHPTVVALQEVDLERERSGHVNQAARLAELSELHWVAAPSFNDGTGDYGNAVLARVPVELVRHEMLPRVGGTEPRSVMLARLEWGGTAVHVVNTHLSFRRVDRPRQLETLRGPAWLGSPALAARTVLCGDLNCSRRDPGFRALLEMLGDAQQATPGRPRPTWPTRLPMRRLDHVLVTPDLEVRAARIVRSRPARLASDHFPLVADVSARSGAGSRTSA